MLYLDTNILIYLLEQHRDYSRRVAGMLEQHAKTGGSLASSAITITEFLAGTKAASAAVLQLVPNLLFIDLDTDTAVRAAALQRKHSLQVGDAIHLATALETKATGFFTNDLALARVAKQYLPVKTLDK